MYSLLSLRSNHEMNTDMRMTRLITLPFFWTIILVHTANEPTNNCICPSLCVDTYSSRRSKTWNIIIHFSSTLEHLSTSEQWTHTRTRTHNPNVVKLIFFSSNESSRTGKHKNHTKQTSLIMKYDKSGWIRRGKYVLTYNTWTTSNHTQSIFSVYTFLSRM